MWAHQAWRPPPPPRIKRRMSLMNDARPLSIPVILGAPSQGRLSEHVARVMVEELCTRDGVQTSLIDVRELPLATTDAGEAIKDPGFSETIMRADGLVIVAPEYNHGYPGILKHALDTNLKEYIHKPVGLCGVSAGGFGGTRVVESLLPVMRELGRPGAGRGGAGGPPVPQLRQHRAPPRPVSRCRLGQTP